MADILLSASILAADFTCLRDQVSAAVDAGVDWIHIDVMDGHFVPNISMGPMIVEACRRITSLPLDVHLMISNPERYVEDFARAGANKITVHIEGGTNIHRTVQSIRALGVSPAITLNPGTPASAIQAMLPFVDMVLVMTVNPGFGGQEFIPESLQKIAEIRDMIARINSKALIQVDGGITDETLPSCYTAGATVYVCGSSIFHDPRGIPAAVRGLRQSVA